MKGFIIGLILLFGLQGCAQEKQKVSYLENVNFSENVNIGDLRIEFAEVLTDSRCPKSVTCVWAGEAKIKVRIYRGKSLLETKVLIFPASGSIDLEANRLFSNDELHLAAVALFPYPEKPEKIPEDQYSIQIKVN